MRAIYEQWGRLTVTRLAMVVSVLVLSVPVPARATQNITVTDDSPIPIVISSYQLTLIKLPATVVPNGLMTVNPAFEIRGNGRNIAIDPKNTTAPGDLVVMTENESYIFQVTPKPIPAEMIVVEDIRQAAGGGKPEADVVRRSDSYPEANVELIRQAAQGTLPRSCILRDVSKKAYPKWLELDVLNVREYRCPQYTVRLYDLYNSKKETQSLRQTEFFTGQELSIALDRSVIANGQSAVVFIVTYTEPLPKEGQGRKGQSPDPDAWRNN